MSLPPSVRKAVLAFRPPELVLLAFLAFLAVKIALAPHAPIHEAERPRSELLAAVMLVVVLRMAVRFLRQAWPDALSVRARRTFLALGLVAALPLAAEVAKLATLDWRLEAGDGDALWHVAMLLFTVAKELLLVGLPLPLAWLGVGLHLKARGKVVAGALVREAGAGLVDVARDWLPPLVLILSYRWLGLVLNGLPETRDAALASVDRFLFAGMDPVAALQAHASRPALEWVTFCYGFFFPLHPIVFGALYALKDRAAYRELALAFCIALALGYGLYTVVPAEGPAYFGHLVPNLNHVYFRAIEENIVQRARIRRDAFPSLHTAVSMIFLWAAVRHRRGLAWAIAPIVLSIPVACVFLGYHYVIDVMCGLLLALLATRLAPRWAAAHASARAEAAEAAPAVQPAA